MEECDVDELLGSLDFESREVYDRAKKEADFIRKVEESVDITDAKTALKLYNKIIAEKSFSTIVGYEFLFALRNIIIETGIASADGLAEIPVREIVKLDNDTLIENSYEVEKFKHLYEGQKILNKKYKISIIVCVLVLVAFIIINFRMEYSIFTYFTNYKANMEEEIINKYEEWEEDLEQREQALSGSDDDVDESEE